MTDRVEEARQNLEYQLQRGWHGTAAGPLVDNLIAAVRAEQPAAVGHVANCRCCLDDLSCWHDAKDGKPRHAYPQYDNLCKPSLLREAEVRLEVFELCKDQIPCSGNDWLNANVAEGRAEIERLLADDKTDT